MCWRPESYNSRCPPQRGDWSRWPCHRASENSPTHRLPNPARRERHPDPVRGSPCHCTLGRWILADKLWIDGWIDGVKWTGLRVLMYVFFFSGSMHQHFKKLSETHSMGKCDDKPWWYIILNDKASIFGSYPVFNPSPRKRHFYVEVVVVKVKVDCTNQHESTKHIKSN